MNSNFDLLFESIMNGSKFNFNSLSKNKIIAEDALIGELKANIILEEINAPQYIVSESTGNAYLLEDVIFMSEEQIISEGIMDKLENTVKSFIEKVADGLKNIIKSSIDKIKEWTDGIMNSSIVKAIRKKLGLDEKLNESSIKECFEIKSSENKGSLKIDEEKLKSLVGGTYESAVGEANKEPVEESVNLSNKNIISEEITLKGDDKEAVDSDDEDAIKKRIEIWTKRASGSVIRKKTGKPWRKSICDKKLALLNKALEELNDDEENEEEDDIESNKNVQQQKQNENVPNEEKQETNEQQEEKQSGFKKLFSSMKSKIGRKNQ